MFLHCQVYIHSWAHFNIDIWSCQIPIVKREMKTIKPVKGCHYHPFSYQVHWLIITVTHFVNRLKYALKEKSPLPPLAKGEFCFSLY